MRIITTVLCVLMMSQPLRADASASINNLIAAQICWLEAAWRKDDCAAIVHLLKRRADRLGKPFSEAARGYGAIKSQQPRAVLARQLPAGDVLTWGALDNTRWQLLREVATGALEGRVADPYRGRAHHFGARNLLVDQLRARDAIAAGRWVLLPGSTANAFYRAVSSRRTLPAATARGAR